MVSSSCGPPSAHLYPCIEYRQYHRVTTLGVHGESMTEVAVLRKYSYNPSDRLMRKYIVFPLSRVVAISRARTLALVSGLFEAEWSDILRNGTLSILQYTGSCDGTFSPPTIGGQHDCDTTKVRAKSHLELAIRAPGSTGIHRWSKLWVNRAESTTLIVATCWYDGHCF